MGEKINLIKIKLMYCKHMKIFGMILCHNCEKLLPRAIERIPFDQLDYVFVTDDGSTDKSVEIAKKLGMDVTISQKQGYGANVKHGLKYAFSQGADYVVEIHGDGAQFDPIAIKPAKKFIDKKYDYIIGSRLINIKRTIELKMPWPRLIANIILSKIDTMILNIPLSECNSGFMIYGPFFKNLNYQNTSDGHLFSFQIIAISAYANLNCAEVPVECDYKSEHTSLSYPKAIIFVIMHFTVCTLTSGETFEYCLWH